MSFPSDPAGSSDLSLASALEALMLFYGDAGVDVALSETPIDRFAESRDMARERSTARMERAAPAERKVQAAPADGQRPSAPAAPRPTPAPPAAAPTLTVPDEAAFADARATAKAASTLAELKAALEGFSGCNLKHSARNTVLADGNPEAELMVIGEAPGRDEDQQGLPFVGRAGQLLDRMLAAIGRDRRTTYITNVIPWRPPGNRTPAPHEIELCRPFVERHVELVKPKALLLLGNVSSKTMLNTDRGILSIRGQFVPYERAGLSIPALPSLHPAYLLRSPAQKRLAWLDLLTLQARLEQAAGSV